MRQIASLRGPRPVLAPLASLAVSPEAPAWILLAVTALAAGTLMSARGLMFDWASAGWPFVACVGLVCGALVYRRWRRDERIATTLVTTAQVVAFSAAGEALSYAVASLDRPLWDATLMAWDQAMGLDWLVYLKAVNAHPHLALLLDVAYASLSAQMIGAVAVLGLSGRLAACRRFALAVMLAALATILVSGAMPAVSMVTHLGLRGTDYPNFEFAVGFAPFDALRGGTLRIVSLAKAEGVISFPSLHAALGVLFVRAFWSVGWARWPALAGNMLLIAATPLEGGHYFVDVIAGIVVALVAIGGADALNRPREEQRPVRSGEPAAPDGVSGQP